MTPGDEAIVFSGTGCRPWMTCCPTWCLPVLQPCKPPLFLGCEHCLQGFRPCESSARHWQKGSCAHQCGINPSSYLWGKGEQRCSYCWKVSHCASSNTSDWFGEPKEGQVICHPSSEPEVLLKCLLCPVRPIKVPVICRWSGWVAGSECDISVSGGIPHECNQLQHVLYFKLCLG